MKRKRKRVHLPSKPKCVVKLRKSRFGVDAVLCHQGHSLNSIALGHKAPLSAIRTARADLMKGCVELVRDHKRHTRRR